MSETVIIGDRVVVAQRRRPGLMLGRMLIVISLGLMAGAADSWVRPIRLSASDPAGRSAQGDTAPSQDTTKTTPAQPVVPPTDATSKPVTPPTDGGSTTTTPVSPTPAEPLGLHINLAQARKLFEDGKPFLDARTIEEFRAGHIAGAFHLPSDAFTRAGGVEALKFLDQNDDLVIYCGGGECHASEYVAIELEKAGFKKYHIMVDGFPAWKTAGYDITTGDQ